MSEYLFSAEELPEFAGGLFMPISALNLFSDFYNKSYLPIVYHVSFGSHLLSCLPRTRNCSIKLLSIRRQLPQRRPWCTSILTKVLHRCNLSKMFGQYGTMNFNFYTFVKEGFVFLVMVDTTVQIMIFSTRPESQSSSWRPFKRNSSTSMIVTAGKLQWRISSRISTPSSKITWTCSAIRARSTN